MSVHVLDRWLTAEKANVGRHALTLLLEIVSMRTGVLDELRQKVCDHYVSPDVTVKRLADLGAPQTAELLKEHLPTTKRARSGDLGEVLATEVAERYLNYRVPVRRLRWKDGREMALRGDDLIGVAWGAKKMLLFLKGESKSRALLTTAVLSEAGQALDRDQGRPTRHSVLFVAERLREQGQNDLAKELEEAVLQSFKGTPVEHLLFVLTGSNPKKLLAGHLHGCARNPQRRYAVGIRIEDHGKFINDLFGGF